jgi:SAM-dependent methyltransferase
MGRWVFETSDARELLIDLLDAQVCKLPGGRLLHVTLGEGFIPTPRLRLSVNGVMHELVTTHASVLERHYSRPRHQDIYSQPDPWIEAFHQARIRQCRRLLHGVRGRVCDIGSGFSLVRNAGPWPFALSTCDRDAEAVAVLRDAGVDAVEAPADDPPFQPHSFDAVYAGEIVEHLVEPAHALRRWVDLVRPGGRLVITTPNRRHLLTRVRGYELVENPEHLFEWDVDELRAAVTAAGARIMHSEGLMLPLPVYVPGRGWRDAFGAAARRIGAPQPLLIRAVELGRPLPALAMNIAVVARAS